MPSSRPPDPSLSSTGRASAPAPVPGAFAPFVQRLHPRLEALLRRVQTAERAAAGEQRRPTFRLMRELLGASVRLGVPAQQLAECLGTSRQSVRNRASGLDGTISSELIQQLTGLTPPQLDRLSRGELTRYAERAGQPAYLTTDVVRALLNTPRPRI